MRVIRILLAVTFAVLAWGSGTALGNGGQVTTDAEHRAEDGAPHDIAAEPRLAAQTHTAIAGDARASAAAVTGPPNVVGQWGALVDWPVVGIHVALLPNGKVLAYDSVGDHA